MNMFYYFELDIKELISLSIEHKIKLRFYVDLDRIMNNTNPK